jgi:hypothetical protein
MADESQDQTDQREADQTDQTTDQTDESTDELGDKGEKALKAERDARRKAERELKALNTRLAELENAGKSEDEKQSAALKAAEDRATALEARIRDTNARSAVTDAATKANAVSTKAVYALIRDDIEFDDDGEPTNIADLIKAAKADEPSLFRASAGSGDGGKGGTPDKANLSQLVRAALQPG